ncbi:MAG TPA: DUF4038 domain-containing protein [Thermomicrobiales bacterium]|nr:DUF4038 domain-containing protein [Thermomicrobiales bacterium]
MIDARSTTQPFPLHDLALEPAGRWLASGGRPVFLLADTCWAAFTRAADQEWLSYLRLRHQQGFNGVLISALPIANDRSIATPGSGGPADRSPFLLDADGNWDRDRLDESYFRHARSMSESALAHGIVPVIVVLWCAWVPETWASERFPGNELTEAQLDRYVDALLAAVGDLSVVFCISGDDKFESAVGVDRYVRALERIRAARPERLTTYHTSPGHEPNLETGRRLIEHPDMDFHMYQSSHFTGGNDVATRLAVTYRALPERRPVINSEPCYEGHRGSFERMRFRAAEVRRASWLSVVGGAAAGLGYGAHGIWSWHRPGDRFLNVEGAGEPFPVEVAMQLPGAWDVGMIRRIVEDHALFDVSAADDLITGDAFGAAVGRSTDPERIVVYRPDAMPVALGIDLTGWRTRGWDLVSHHEVPVAFTVADGVTSIAQPQVLSDTVVVFSR